MSCKFINKKTDIKCQNDVLEGYEYCAKHKRYSYAKSVLDNTTDQQNKKDNSDDIAFSKQNENIAGIDMSNIMNSNEDMIIMNKNNKINDDLNIIMPNSDNIEQEEQFYDIDETNKEVDKIHNGREVAELLYPFILCTGDLIEKVSEQTKERTNVVIKNLSNTIIKKEVTYKELISKTSEREPEAIDAYLTPGRALLAHFVVDVGTSVEVQKKTS
jgi:hypothetical protein